MSAIHETESIPFTKAPSNGDPDKSTGTGRGSSNAARRAHIELSSSLCNKKSKFMKLNGKTKKLK